MLIKVYITALKRFRIISILFDSQRVGTGVAVLCCHGKSSSYIPTSKVIRSCSYGKISLNTSNAF